MFARQQTKGVRWQTRTDRTPATDIDKHHGKQHEKADDDDYHLQKVCQCDSPKPADGRVNKNNDGAAQNADDHRGARERLEYEAEGHQH